MRSPRRIQLSRRRGWRLPHNAASVARPSRYGNPYPIGSTLMASGVVPFGPEKGFVWELPVPGGLTAGQSVAMYREYLVERLKEEPSFLEPLRGKDLACYCAPGEPCHVDVILEFANS